MEKKITITVDVDGNSVTREYSALFLEGAEEVAGDVWGQRILDMLDTVENSKDVKEF